MKDRIAAVVVVVGMGLALSDSTVFIVHAKSWLLLLLPVVLFFVAFAVVGCLTGLGAKTANLSGWLVYLLVVLYAGSLAVYRLSHLEEEQSGVGAGIRLALYALFALVGLAGVGASLRGKPGTVT
ncbi:MAG: hypothetical protein O7J95_16980 [Planctomycetota bacterium]|nr:hypothetical protein [Planctomycetota bacterium]